MKITINHIAMVMPDLDEGVGFWADALGLKVEARRREAAEEVEIAFLPVGESEIELLAPFTEDSGVAKYLAKRGPGMHHICLEVDDIEETLQRLQAHNVPLIDETPRTNSAGRRMAFIHPKGTGGVLIELYERDND
ncbi:MAG: methylmalonyl-CoA epimerase [Ardenticatenaceae bacterium]|nr:methylmalonyl-CoA epimerase [Ardenticatenaceae bacterium]